MNTASTSSTVVVDLTEVTNTCFVVMPFQATFESEYTKVIRPAIEAKGLKCVRGDEIYSRQSIVHDIWLSIRKARLVVVELSDRNPNVMYEIGLAHAIGKPIILLTRSEDDVPFDLKSLRYVFYDIREPDWGSFLRDQLSHLVEKVLDEPQLGRHLEGIAVQSSLPELPSGPIVSRIDEEVGVNLEGVWRGSWLSVKKERRHDAVLVIPNNHDASFMATMNVHYSKDEDVTIVQETLSASIRGSHVRLSGVSYTYLIQGASTSYSLDSFELNLVSPNRLVGTAVLRNGDRQIAFDRVEGTRPS